MGVGEDVAVGANEEAGAEIVFVIAGLDQIGLAGLQAFEKFGKRVVFRQLVDIVFATGQGGVFIGAAGLNVNHGAAFLFDQLGEIGQQHIGTAYGRAYGADKLGITSGLGFFFAASA